MDGSEQVTVKAGANSVSVTFDRSLYPLDVVYGAAYVFIDRCYVLLDSPEEGRLSVQLRGREPLAEEQLRGLAGEFGNEVLTQIWRQETTRQNLSIVEVVTARALAGAQAAALDAPAAAPPADVADDEDLADAFDDPLGIAVPWEEKYGKDDKKAGDGGAS